MKLLGELVRILTNRIYFPWYHRVAPSLRRHTTLHGVLLPTHGDRRPDLYLSPFPERNWTDIWNLTLEFDDEPGVLARVTTLLGDPAVGVNLLAHEVVILPHKHEPHGRISLICDMSQYGGPANPDGTTARRERDPDARLDYLLDYLTLELWPLLRFNRHRPQIFATRLRELQSIALLVRDLKGERLSGTR